MELPLRSYKGYKYMLPIVYTCVQCWELLAQKIDRFQMFCNNSQQHTQNATAWNRVFKQTQHVTSNNVGS